jgi:hypothetical protein
VLVLGEVRNGIGSMIVPLGIGPALAPRTSSTSRKNTAMNRPSKFDGYGKAMISFRHHTGRHCSSVRTMDDDGTSILPDVVSRNPIGFGTHWKLEPPPKQENRTTSVDRYD